MTPYQLSLVDILCSNARRMLSTLDAMPVRGTEDPGLKSLRELAIHVQDEAKRLKQSGQPCICADPENCREPVRGCKRTPMDGEQWAL